MQATIVIFMQACEQPFIITNTLAKFKCRYRNENANLLLRIFLFFGGSRIDAISMHDRPSQQGLLQSL